MKKMEKTAGEKPGKDAAIRKDSENSAEKIVVPDPVKDEDKKKDGKGQPGKESQERAAKKEPNSSTHQNNSTASQVPVEEKGKGLKSAVEGNNNNSPLPTDDDGKIVL